MTTLQLDEDKGDYKSRRVRMSLAELIIWVTFPILGVFVLVAFTH